MLPDVVIVIASGRDEVLKVLLATFDRHPATVLPDLQMSDAGGLSKTMSH